MKVVYSNITPISTSYSNVFHLYYLFKTLKAERIILCVWDAFVIDDKRFHKLTPERRYRQTQLGRNVQILERVLQSMHADYKIIKFSEAIARFFRQKDGMLIFQRVLAKVTYKDLRERAGFRYGDFDDMTLSKMNYIILDYLIATLFTHLFPEYGESSPSLYVANERFKVFHPGIKESFAEQFSMETLPKVELVQSIPLILDRNGFMPSLDMTPAQRTSICRDFVDENLSEKFCDDLMRALNYVLEGNIELDKEKKNAEEIKRLLMTNPKEYLPKLINFYYVKLSEHISAVKTPEKIPTIRISDSKRLQEVLGQMTPLKLKILRLCNGKNTSVEIAKILKAKPITVSVYLGRLRSAGLISSGRRPKKLIKNVVFDIDNISF